MKNGTRKKKKVLKKKYRKPKKQKIIAILESGDGLRKRVRIAQIAMKFIMPVCKPATTTEISWYSSNTTSITTREYEFMGYRKITKDYIFAEYKEK